MVAIYAATHSHRVDVGGALRDHRRLGRRHAASGRAGRPLRPPPRDDRLRARRRRRGRGDGGVHPPPAGADRACARRRDRPVALLLGVHGGRAQPGPGAGRRLGEQHDLDRAQRRRAARADAGRRGGRPARPERRLRGKRDLLRGLRSDGGDRPRHVRRPGSDSRRGARGPARRLPAHPGRSGAAADHARLDRPALPARPRARRRAAAGTLVRRGRRRLRHPGGLLGRRRRSPGRSWAGGSPWRASA